MKSIKKISVLLVSVSVLMFAVGFILKDILLLPVFYKSNNEFGEEINREIKSLVLNCIKDRHSSLLSYVGNELYSESFANEQGSDLQEKHWLIDINDNFMDSLEKEDDKYSVKLSLIFPDDPTYYFTITEENGRYQVSDIQIDP